MNSVFSANAQTNSERFASCEHNSRSKRSASCERNSRSERSASCERNLRNERSASCERNSRCERSAHSEHSSLSERFAAVNDKVKANSKSPGRRRRSLQVIHHLRSSQHIPSASSIGNQCRLRLVHLFVDILSPKATFSAIPF